MSLGRVRHSVIRRDDTSGKRARRFASAPLPAFGHLPSSAVAWYSRRFKKVRNQGTWVCAKTSMSVKPSLYDSMEHRVNLLRMVHSKRMSASALITTTPNMRCFITLLTPLTLSVCPPWLSLRLEFTRSALLRALYWRARSGSIGADAVPRRYSHQ